MANTISENPNRPTPPDANDVVVGRIKGPWGLDGDLKVEPLTDFSSRFSPGTLLYLDGVPTKIERSRSVKGAILVKLDSVTDRSKAEQLRGHFLAVSQSEVPPLAEGSYYHFEIIGLSVWSDEGEYLGHVREILPTGSHDVYIVVDCKIQRELLIPARTEIIREVNLLEGKITVCLPNGLR